MQDENSERLVVVADDERDIADFLTLNLTMEGYRVETVYDGQAALDAVRALHPDVVLLDVMMPNLDGIQVLQAIKADPDTKAIPVIMLTAKAGDADVWAGWQAGASYYVTKPFDIDELLRYLRHLEAAELIAEVDGTSASAPR